MGPNSTTLSGKDLPAGGAVNRPEEDPVRMRRASAVLCLAVLAAAAGCSDDPQPSPPPEPVDSVGGSTSESPPPDDDVVTETATATASPTTEASGAPELPEEATEQTEAGAEAFVGYYFDALNYGTLTPDAEAVMGTGLATCQTCATFEQMLVSLAAEKTRSDGPALDLLQANAAITGDEAEVATKFVQLNPAALGPNDEVVEEPRPPQEVAFIFTLQWKGRQWQIQEID